MHPHNHPTVEASVQRGSSRMMDRVDVAIIGAGQAGLALSYYLTQQGRDHVLLEKATRLAEPWRSNRWDSFAMVTPNWTLQMPGFAYQGDDPDGFLPRAGIVRYFEDYSASFGPPVLFGIEVLAVDSDPSGEGFIITTNAGRMRANEVVVATGSHQYPKFPATAGGLPPNIVQMHSSHYRNPDALPPGAVLVVGTAQSGTQIADDLARSGREVYLSVSGAGRAPQRYRGQYIFKWLVQVGFFDTPWEMAPEPKSRFEAPPHVAGGRELNLHQFARDGVHLLGHVLGAGNGTLHIAPDLHANLAKADGFAAHVKEMFDGFIAKSGLDAPPAEEEPELKDGFATPIVTELNLAKEGITSVIWATGYRLNFDWVHAPVFDAQNFPIQDRGVTNVPGLSFLGLFWMHTRGSGTIYGVGKDAAYLAEQIAERNRAGRTVNIPLAS